MKIYQDCNDKFGYISVNKFEENYEIFINDNHMASIELTKNDLEKFLEAIKVELLR